ncbi:MAG: RidA family protein [Alphaproteobacteria bacterium]|nr:RidA family protein [Alphaproteobacteria bacterium]
MVKHLNFPDIVDSDAPFTSVVVDDRYAFIAGVVAADTVAGQALLGDIAAETGEVMETIGRLLAKIDLAMSDIVRVDVHLTDINQMDAMNQIYRTFFDEGAHPARTCVQSEGLYGGSLVEVTCVARLRDLA